MVYKASKLVYFSDNHESIMISYRAKITSYFKNNRHVGPPSWISKLLRNVRKSPNLIYKNRTNYKDAKNVKIWKKLFVISNPMKTENEAENTKFG